jgi:hypothetical protein
VTVTAWSGAGLQAPAVLAKVRRSATVTAFTASP